MLAAVSDIIRHTTFKCEWSWVIEFFPLQNEKYASSCWVSNHFVKLAFKCCLNWVFDVNNSDWDIIRFRYLLKSPLFYLTHIWTLYSTVKLSSVTVSWLLFVIKKYMLSYWEEYGSKTYWWYHLCSLALPVSCCWLKSFIQVVLAWLFSYIHFHMPHNQISSLIHFVCLRLLNVKNCIIHFELGRHLYTALQFL